MNTWNKWPRVSKTDVKVILLFLFLFTAIASISCSGEIDNSQESLHDAGNSAGTCVVGQTHCIGKNYETCVKGKFTQVETCTDNKRCVEYLGCVDCNPTAGKQCVDNMVYACNHDGTLGQKIKDCATEICKNGTCTTPTCSGGAQLIYVVDDKQRLLSFNPAKGANTFTLIGTLKCPASTATPFSMSVDRGARAWVLYTNGNLYFVNTKNADCQVSQFSKGQSGFEQFGMGFVSNSAGSSGEKLYISGGAGTGGEGNLGFIEPTTLKVTKIGSLPQSEYSPELTGTGNGSLFGYFPGAQSSFVAELDKQNATVKKSWPLPPLKGMVSAWAFAHWGGRFYIFVTTTKMLIQTDSQVLRLDPSTGKTDTLLTNLPYKIVGAGVSTCAPLVLPDF